MYLDLRPLVGEDARVPLRPLGNVSQRQRLDALGACPVIATMGLPWYFSLFLRPNPDPRGTWRFRYTPATRDPVRLPLPYVPRRPCGRRRARSFCLVGFGLVTWKWQVAETALQDTEPEDPLPLGQLGRLAPGAEVNGPMAQWRPSGYWMEIIWEISAC